MFVFSMRVLVMEDTDDNHNPSCHLHGLIWWYNETMISFDYHRIKKSLSKPIKCNWMPALHHLATMACVALSRRRHGNSVSGHATECLFFFLSYRVSFHLRCGSRETRWKFGSFQSKEKRSKGTERMRWRKGGRGRNEGCFPPEGLKQNRETEGLCFLVLNGVREQR